MKRSTILTKYWQHQSIIKKRRLELLKQEMKGHYYGTYRKFRSNIGKYRENLYSKFNNIDEFDKFLERFKLLNLKQE